MVISVSSSSESRTRSPSSATWCGLLVLRWLSLQRSEGCLSSLEYHFLQTKRSSHCSSALMPCTLCTFPARNSARHSPLYVSNTARGNVGMTIDESGTSFPPTYEKFAVRAITAAGLSGSYALTVVREPGLPMNAPASPVVTLASLDAAVLVSR